MNNGVIDWKLNEAQRLSVNKLADSLRGFSTEEIIEILEALRKESVEFKEYEEKRRKSDKQMYQSWPKDDDANYW